MSRLFISWDGDSGLTVDLTLSSNDDGAIDGPVPADRVDDLARRAMREVFDPIAAVGREVRP